MYKYQCEYSVEEFMDDFNKRVTLISKEEDGVIEDIHDYMNKSYALKKINKKIRKKKW